MNKKALTSLLATGVMAVAFSATSHAAPINGGFSLGNNSGGTVTTQFNNAPTTLTFNPTAPANINVETGTGGVTGDFSSLLATTKSGKILDVTSNPFGPQSNFINIIAGASTIQFDLASLTLTGALNAFVIGQGTGTFIVTGFDPTPGFLSFTTQKASSDTNTWSLSLTTTNPSVPEPETLALFAIGLAALVVNSRKAAKK